jgi:hypothetical protein
MKFSHQMTYDAPPADVQAMLADPAFREQVCAAMNAVRHDVEVTGSGAGMKVVVDQTQPADGIPSFAKKIVGDEIHIVQRETWNDASDATLVVEIPGKPGAFRGGIDLAGDGDGTVETALKSEQRVGRAWLAGDR